MDAFARSVFLHDMKALPNKNKDKFMTGEGKLHCHKIKQIIL